MATGPPCFYSFFKLKVKRKQREKWSFKWAYFPPPLYEIARNGLTFWKEQRATTDPTLREVNNFEVRVLDAEDGEDNVCESGGVVPVI